MYKRSLSVFLIIAMLVALLPSSNFVTKAMDSSATDLSSAMVETSNEYSSYLSYYEGKSFAEKEYVAEFSGKAPYSANINIEKEGLFNVEITYKTLESNTKNLITNLKFDDNIPFADCGRIELNRYYADADETFFDSRGNEIKSEVKEVYGTYTSTVSSIDNLTPYYFYLSQGTHTVTLENVNGNFEILKIRLFVENEPLTYREYLKKFNGKDYNGKQIQYEAEADNLYLRTDKYITGLSDASSAKVSPSSPSNSLVNYTGGNNYSQPGTSISWKVSVEKTGFYNISLNYRQKYTLNTTFYRQLKIDGEIPFKEMEEVAFPYSRNWSLITLGNEKENYRFYFESGKEYEITLTVTLGPLKNVCERIGVVTSNIASFYRQIVMITGDTPDINRDYNLFEQIGDWDNILETNITELKSIKNEISKIMGNDGTSNISTLNNLINVLERMRDNKYSAHKQKDRLYTNYASLSSMVGELKKMPLDVDFFTFNSPNEKAKNENDTFWNNTYFSIKKFFYSFVKGYSLSEDPNREAITIWVNWGRDQTKVLTDLVVSDFSTKYNIDVDIKITNATLIHAALSGRGPDCVLHLSRSEPVNLAMRDQLFDLTRFDGKGEYADLPDYKEILKRFVRNASTPYWFENNGHNGLYGIPDTQNFFMMFIRDDIFAEMGLEVPKTWDEFDEVSNVLFRSNLQVGLPYTQITEMTQVNTGIGSLSIFPTFLIQKGESIYNKDYTATNLLSETSIDTFKRWTDYYQKMGLEKTYDFFNRFRVGLMPMAIQNYTVYANLISAAPEISDLWTMYEIPGYRTEDGTINNNVTGGGTAACILSTSEHKEAAWEFICWWTDKDAQHKYCSGVESVLGPAARVATSNVDALKMYEFSDENLNNLLNQWNKVEELPEVPGGYYIARVIDQVFWNTLNSDKDPQDLLLKWSEIADNEITRRREQYDIK